MIHYHGTPIGGTRQDAARRLAGRHALVPFPRQDDMGIVAETCQSFRSGICMSRLNVCSAWPSPGAWLPWAVRASGARVPPRGGSAWVPQWTPFAMTKAGHSVACTGCECLIQQSSKAYRWHRLTARTPR